MVNDSNLLFTAEYAVKAGEKYYFVACEMNVICSIDFQAGSMEIIGSIPEEDVFLERVCIKIVAWNEELIFVPMNGRKVWFFHVKDRTWKPLEIRNDNIQRKIRQAFVYKNKLYMVGCHYPAIICVDLKTEHIQYVDAPFKEVRDVYQKRDMHGYFRHDCVLKGHLLYFASFITNKVLVFDLENFHWEYVTVGETNNGYSGIAWDGNYFWLAPNDKKCIVRWDGGKLYWEYPLPFHGMNKKIMFLGVVFWNGDIIFPAFRTDCTLILHHADVERYEIKKEQYLFYTICDERNIICGDKHGNIISYTDKGEKYCVKCRVSENELLKKLNITEGELKRYLQVKFSDIAYEDSCFGLHTLLSYLDKNRSEKGSESYCGKNSKEIWQKLIWRENINE